MQRKTSVLLLFLCAVLALPGCGEAASPASEQQPVPDTDLSAAETEAPADPTAEAVNAILASYADKDYNGYEFKILDRDEEHHGEWMTCDVFSEGATGDPINDAVYIRNQMLEETFNIKITEAPAENPANVIKQIVPAGDDAYDLVTDGLCHLANLTSSNMLYDFNDISDIQLDGAWWDQNMRREFTICGKLFFETGDISIMDNEGTWCVLFNKQLAEQHDFGSLYELVNNGAWTMDRMYDMMKAVAADIDGDGKMTKDDRWGYIGESFNIYAFWVGGGDRIASIGDDGLPTITMYNERSSSVYDKVLTMQFDKSCSGLVSAAFSTFDEIYTCFKDGRALFEYGAMDLVSDYRDSATNFGILPAPKYDEAQKDYANTFSYGNMAAYSIPTTAGNIHRTGAITEAMAQISRYTLTPAYYDVSLKGKFVRDTESEEMLDLILNTRSYDIGSILQWGTSFSIFTGAGAAKVGTFASQYEKGKKGIEKAMNKYIDALRNME